ncbi:hypothetical protein ABID58_007082 [Bradyrhizobium sp. S3.2.6]
MYDQPPVRWTNMCASHSRMTRARSSDVGGHCWDLLAGISDESPYDAQRTFGLVASFDVEQEVVARTNEIEPGLVAS